jgi:hypothetical protein
MAGMAVVTGGGGGIGGSTGATDNRVLRADGNGGGTLQNSAVTIDDSGNVRLTAAASVVIGTNAYAYNDGVGPTTLDEVTGFTSTTNVQALTADRTITLPNAAGTMVLDTATQVLTNKTVTQNTLRSRVSTQFDVTSSTALANITGLSLTVVAGKTYHFEAFLHTTANVAGGVQFAIAGTATATAVIYEALVDNSAAFAAQGRATTLGSAVGGSTTATTAFCYISGTITVNVGGTLTVQFAQNASNAAASSVLVGSAFTAEIIP